MLSITCIYFFSIFPPHLPTHTLSPYLLAAGHSLACALAGRSVAGRSSVAHRRGRADAGARPQRCGLTDAQQPWCAAVGELLRRGSSATGSATAAVQPPRARTPSHAGNLYGFGNRVEKRWNERTYAYLFLVGFRTPKSIELQV